MINEVRHNQLLIPFGDNEAATQAAIQRFQQRNNISVESGLWSGEKVMRISIISNESKEDNIEILLNEIQDCWQLGATDQITSNNRD